MRRTAAAVGALLAVCALVVAASVPVPVAAHTNDVNADPQASPDGTLVVESAFIAADGFLAVQLDDGGAPGVVVGHVALDAGAGFQTDVRVDIADDAWRGWERRTVHLVLRQDDGDGRFEPGEDPAVQSFGETAESVVAVERGDRAVVTARGFGPQATQNGTVTVRRAALPDAGHLVVENATSGARLGSRALAAGVHRNVSVDIGNATGEFAARAVLYRDDGDGALDAGDEPVRVGGEPVATRFGVRAPNTETAGVTTPTATQSVVTTPTATPGASETADFTATDGQPGFGSLLALVALAAAALVAVRGRR